MRSTAPMFASSRGRSPSPTAGTTRPAPATRRVYFEDNQAYAHRHFNSRTSRQRVVPCEVVHPDSFDAVANSLAVSTVHCSRHLNNANRREHATTAHVSTRPGCVRRMDKSAELVASETTSLAVAAQRRPHFTTSNSIRRVNASIIDISLLPMTLSLNVSLIIVTLIISWSCE